MTEGTENFQMTTYIVVYAFGGFNEGTKRCQMKSCIVIYELGCLNQGAKCTTFVRI